MTQSARLFPDAASSRTTPPRRSFHPAGEALKKYPGAASIPHRVFTDDRAMTYEEWLAQYQEQFDANRFSWEFMFADRVLKRLDELDFTYVKYQREVHTDGPSDFRVDFSIELPELAPLAIEVHGATKYDGGTRGPNARELAREESRRRELKKTFVLIEFANVETRDWPDKCVDDLRGAIAELRANQNKGAMQEQLTAIQQAVERLGSGGLSEADQQRLSAAERESAKAKKAAKQSLRESAEIRSKLDAMEKREAPSPTIQANVSDNSRVRLYAGGAVVLVLVAVGLWLLLRAPGPPSGQVAAPAALCSSALTSAEVLARAQDGAAIAVRGIAAEVKGSYINIDALYAKGSPGVAIHLDSAAGDPPSIGTRVAASGLADLQNEAGRVVINVNGVADVLDCS